MFDVAMTTAKGGRPHMEDFVHVEHPFAGHPDWLFAGVFDGHGGDSVSRRAALELHRLLAAEILAGQRVDAAVRGAFRAFDGTVAEEPSGSTAAVVLLQGTALTVANAGDSHVVLVSSRGATILTTDHRLSNEAEHRRVVASGAVIWGPYATLPEGPGLMCTRSLGDHAFRRIGIVPDPDVTTRAWAAEDAWIVAGSDGVWDGLSPEDVNRLVRDAATAREATERVRDAALAATTDNVSVIAIRRA